MFKFLSNAPSGAITHSRRKDRATDELIGICRGLLADGSTNVNEASFLLDWIRRNEEFRDAEPFKTLYARLADALQDGVLDPSEESDLLGVMHATVGGEATGIVGVLSKATTLPLCDPAPTLIFSGAVFVPTGTFQYGTRRRVFDAIEERGGVTGNAVTKRTRYLVIGEIGSRDWMHSSFGRKIEQAMELRSSGVKISIVSEPHWTTHL